MKTRNNNPTSQNHPPPPLPKRPPVFKLKSFLLWASAILALLLAVSFPFPNYPHLLKPNLFQKFLALLPTSKQREPPPISTRPPCVLWMAPFLSGGGYSSEAWSYITSLSTKITNPNIKLKIADHGDLESIEFWHGLPQESKSLANKLYNTECRTRETIVVCHSEPGAWYPPLFLTSPCPPSGYEGPLFVVGRTMFETDRLTPEHVRRCNQMDSIWVPTQFHVATFVNSGVDRSKVVKIVQPVDVEFFDPLKNEASILPSRRPDEFVFLSVFKWEYRKGWDVLLKSFLSEFSESDGAALYLLVNAYHSGRDFGNKIKKLVEEFGIEEPVDGWAPVHVLDNHIPQKDLPGIYKAADVFVLPSRGEGWGRPIVEAMAMGLPVIATNWSGPTEYLSEENGYPLLVDHMSEVTEGPFKGHLWAEPSIDKLRVLMRHLVSNPQEGRRKGKKAREDMIERFSPEVVARVVADEITKIYLNYSDRIGM